MRPATVALAYAAVALLAAAMGGTLAHAVLSGDLRAEGAAIAGLPWGLATLVEVYVGLALFSGWVVWREPRTWVALAWVGSLLALGNLVCTVYVLRALHRSRGDAVRFWLGDRRAATVDESGDNHDVRIESDYGLGQR